ncbi:uncharacterized protein C8orf48 homolog isoform X4 [Rhinoderma darwinii]|uniref:uncharacterized protein C8orf48 homolog isoform X4 n=1 Tax=Rhinoderma darwinii TaxID=43563 RepID=UPI003F677201
MLFIEGNRQEKRRVVMALSPVSEESPHFEEVLQRSGSLSGAASYSGESFESSTEESSGKSENDSLDYITDEHTEEYHSDSFESFADDSSRQQRSDNFSLITNGSSRNYESDSFETFSSDLDVHQTHSPENSYIESVSVEDDHSKKDQVAHRESSGSASKALQSYCYLKIQHLRHPLKNHRQKKSHLLTHPSSVISKHQSCPVPHELMNRLELQRTKETINQVIKTEMHDPASCPECCNKQAELAQCQFIRMKKTKLEADLLQTKMEDYKYSKDLVTRIGEIHQSLPKSSDERTAIWQRLYTNVMKM